MSIRPMALLAMQMLALCAPALGRGGPDDGVTYGRRTRLSQEAYEQILGMLVTHMTEIAREDTSRRPRSPSVPGYTEITLCFGGRTYLARTDLALRGLKLRDGKIAVIGAWLTTLGHWKLADGTEIPPYSKVRITSGHGTVTPAVKRGGEPAKTPRMRGRGPESTAYAEAPAGGSLVRIRVKEPFLVLEGTAGGGIMGQNCTLTLQYEKTGDAPAKAQCMREFDFKLKSRTYTFRQWDDYEMPKPRGEREDVFFTPGTVQVSGEGRVRIYLRDAKEKVISNVLVVPVAADRATAKALAARLGAPARPKPKPSSKPKRHTSDDEAAAAKTLQFAKMCLANGVGDLATKKLKEIVEKHPKTQAAKEARALLKSQK